MPFQPRTIHDACPVCQDKKIPEKYVINDFLIAQCRSCGLMFVKDCPSQEELDFHYGKDTANLNEDDDYVYLNPDNVENLKYYYRNLRSIIKERIPSGAVLDIGCNAGYFLDEMEGFSCYGVERSPSHGNIAKEKYGDNIFIGIFEEYDPGDLVFDCITLQDVFDHMVDPVSVLRKCHAMLKPGGLIAIKVHDMSCLYAKITGKNFYAFLPPLHLFYFNRKSLALALERASFNMVCSKHMGHEMFISTIFYRLSRGVRNSLFFKLYERLDKAWLGRQKIVKNLNDIITVIAVKK